MADWFYLCICLYISKILGLLVMGQPPSSPTTANIILIHEESPGIGWPSHPKSNHSGPLRGKSRCLDFQFSSVAQSCPTLCDPMNRSTPGLPVHHQFPEFTQTHVHQVGDAIQPSHLLSSPSPPGPNPSQRQGLFQWVNSSHEGKKESIKQGRKRACWPPKTQADKPSSWALTPPAPNHLPAWVGRGKGQGKGTKTEAHRL